MAHQRKLIRKSLVALLASANTAAGTRVQGTRVEPHRRTQLPALSVYTLREPVRETSAGTTPRELTRDLKIEIAGWVAHTEALPVDDAMDDLAEQVERAIDASPYLGGVVADIVLESTDMEVIEDDGRSDPMVGIVTLTYSATYYTEPAAGTVDDLLTVGSTIKPVGGVADTPTISDVITVQEIA